MVVDRKSRNIAANLMIIVICMPLVGTILRIILDNEIGSAAISYLFLSLYLLAFNALVYLWAVIGMLKRSIGVMLAIPFIIHGSLNLIGSLLGMFRSDFSGVSFGSTLIILANLVGAVSVFTAIKYKKNNMQCKKNQFLLVVELAGAVALVVMEDTLHFLTISVKEFIIELISLGVPEIIKFLAIFYIFKAIRNELSSGTRITDNKPIQ